MVLGMPSFGLPFFEWMLSFPSVGWVGWRLEMTAARGIPCAEKQRLQRLATGSFAGSTGRPGQGSEPRCLDGPVSCWGVSFAMVESIWKALAIHSGGVFSSRAFRGLESILSVASPIWHNAASTPSVHFSCS